jgi:hypothetical protein
MRCGTCNKNFDYGLFAMGGKSWCASCLIDEARARGFVDEEV